ncbi:FecR family protein [Flexithrix dorotheae]|uniref:FecR family protein n=1 Tax=Flexithrix dorotheae TaxID=70993 RepID=UPI00037BD5FC|nr:FecR family protein [Flexithrix dorotheae]
MKYDNYSIGDFLEDDFFVKWVKYPDAESNYFWNKWLANNPQKTKLVSRARNIVESITYEHIELPTDQEFIEVLENIHKLSSSPTIKVRLHQRMWFRMAATFLILLGCFTLFYFHEDLIPPSQSVQVTSHESPQMMTKETKKGQKLSMVLGDGTFVKLNAESELKLPEKFSNDNRSVALTGEAYFEVAKDTTRPFIIQSKGVMIMVVGTSFNIKAYPEKEIVKVAVTSGKVMVKDQQKGKDQTQSYLLERNDLYIFNSNTRQEKVFRNTDITDETAWKDGILVYKKALLQDIFKDVERWYDVEISLETPVSQQDLYSGSFDNKSLQNVLQGISFSSGLSYRIEDKMVFFYKK